MATVGRQSPFSKKYSSLCWERVLSANSGHSRISNVLPLCRNFRRSRLASVTHTFGLNRSFNGLSVDVALDLYQMRFYITTPSLLGIFINPLDDSYWLTFGEIVVFEVKEHI